MRGALKDGDHIGVAVEAKHDDGDSKQRLEVEPEEPDVAEWIRPLSRNLTGSDDNCHLDRQTVSCVLLGQTQVHHPWMFQQPVCPDMVREKTLENFQWPYKTLDPLYYVGAWMGVVPTSLQVQTY